MFYRPVVTEGPNAGRVSIRVYTTITGNSVRTCGEDSIRVCGVYTDRNGKEWGLCKTRRTHRTGKVLDIPARMLDRMREVWAATAKASMVTCGCGAPKFVSKKGNLVCAERCFNRHRPA